MSTIIASVLWAWCENTRTLDFAQRAGLSAREAFVLLRDVEYELIEFLGLPK